MLLVAMASSGRVNTVSDSDNWENAGESPTNPLFSSHQGRGETFSDLLDGVKQKLQGKRREMLRAPFSINTLSSPAKKKKYIRENLSFIFLARKLYRKPVATASFFFCIFLKNKNFCIIFFFCYFCAYVVAKNLSPSLTRHQFFHQLFLPPFPLTKPSTKSP